MTIETLAKLQAASMRLEALVKVMDENLEIAKQNLLAAAIELRQPVTFDESLLTCYQCNVPSETRFCSEDCAYQHEYDLKEAGTTGN